MADRAAKLGCRDILLPAYNAAEAAVVSGINVRPVKDLNEAVLYLRGQLDVPAGLGEVVLDDLREEVVLGHHEEDGG